MQNIGQDTVKYLIVPLPPLHEQRAIIVDLKQELNHLERMRGALTSSIEKLREYRQTLISAAVTGQIPVREEIPA
jgi:type I restriction enzyme S subunit